MYYSNNSTVSSWFSNAVGQSTVTMRIQGNSLQLLSSSLVQYAHSNANSCVGDKYAFLKKSVSTLIFQF